MFAAVMASSLGGCVADEDESLADPDGETSTVESELLAPYHLLKSANGAAGCLESGDAWAGALPQMNPTCANTAKYAWTFTNGDTGHIRAQNHPSTYNLCLGAAAATPGTPVKLVVCDGSKLGQKFTFQHVRTVGSRRLGWIVSRKTGACMANGGGPGAYPVMRACADTANQLWERAQPAVQPPPGPQCTFTFCFRDPSTQICSAIWREVSTTGSCNYEAVKAEVNRTIGLNYQFHHDGACPWGCQ